MNSIRMAIILGLLSGCMATAYAAEDASEQPSPPCDVESDDSCMSEEDEELDRGFDPCLINASLPACKSETKDGEPGSTEDAAARPEESSDSDDG